MLCAVIEYNFPEPGSFETDHFNVKSLIEVDSEDRSAKIG
jgi:hypothetical protein